jgi:molybdopterin biosynthesis enzyme
MQSSAMLRSFAVSQALVFIPSTVGSVAKNDLVTAYKLT